MPLVCGILNVTPDSFSDGGRFASTDAAIAHGLQLIADGAELLDIGGESTRPGATPVSASQELERVIPVIRGLRIGSNIRLCIDSMKPKIARAAMAAGADIWNDVSALGFDPTSMQTAADLACPVVLMHMQGTPKTMQSAPQYDDPVTEVIAWLNARITSCIAAGIAKDNIMVDPGIGFGKRLADNLALLAGLKQISQQTGCGLYLGASRKSFIELLEPGANANQRLGGSLACVAAAFRQNVAIIRVHDVRETVQMLRVLTAIDTAEQTNA
ncbi:Dihydropteroate synthase [hydrothermal vent metagenome]|uniref:dihydropteroate synthase n=1 Tax=hydrothermal vent metagenome TaxID=652676 RepID=A0A3B0RVL9_9ZZZZ